METGGEKPEFWETAFNDKKEMWGLEPARSALLARDLFTQKGLKNILVPGIGYGRNAKAFLDAGMNVTGIEISQTAIEMAKEHYGTRMRIYHGSVTDMPFDNLEYDGVFSYALIHLLDEAERKKLISDCYSQLADGGYMVFTMISKTAATYGRGTLIGKDRYEQFGGVKMYFYDRESVDAEFSSAGLYAIEEINENYPFWLVKCKNCP